MKTNLDRSFQALVWLFLAVVGLAAMGALIGPSSAQAQLAGSGQLLVADAGADSVFVIDRVTGSQSLLASGPPLSEPSGISVDPTTGLVYVADRSGGPGGIGALIEIDPADGSMAVVSSGNELAMPEDVIVSSSGLITVIDGLSGAVLVDPETGDQTVRFDQTGGGITRLALFGRPRQADALVVEPVSLQVLRLRNSADEPLLVGQGGALRLPTGVTTRGAFADFAMVSDAGTLASADGKVIEVRITTFTDINPEANQRIVAEGINLVDPIDLVTDGAAVFLYVLDPAASAGAGAVIRVDATTGDQMVLSSGGVFVTPSAIELFPLVASRRVDADVFVVDSGGAEVLGVDVASGQQSTVSSGGDLVEPAGIVSVPDSNELLIADRRATDPGALLSVDRATGQQIVLTSGQNLDNPEDLILLPNGDVLLADSFAPSLVRFSPGAGGAQTAVPGSPDSLTGIAIDGLAQVFGLQASPPTVWRLDLQGSGAMVVGNAGNMSAPVDLVAESSGTLLVLDDTGGIIRIDPDAYDNGNPSSNQSVVVAADQLESPTGIALAPDGKILVTDPGAEGGQGALLRFFATGGSATTLTSGDRFIAPSAAAVVRPVPRAGDIIVSDPNRDQIVLIDPNNGDQRVLAARGLLSFPDGIALDPDGGLLVAEAGNNLLVHIDLLTGDQTIVASGPDLPDPRAVAVGPDGSIFVGSRVSPYPLTRVDPTTGDTVVIGRNSQDPGAPLGESRWLGLQKLVVDPVSGDIFASTDVVGINVSGDSVVRVDPTALPLPTAPAVVASGEPFVFANEMVIEPDSGDLFVANGTSIVRLDPTTGDTEIVTEGGFLDRAAGLAMEASGSLVTSTVFGDSILRIDPETGSQELVSFAGELAQPQGLVVVPVPEPSIQLGFATAIGVLALLRGVRRRSHSGRV